MAKAAEARRLKSLPKKPAAEPIGDWDSPVAAPSVSDVHYPPSKLFDLKKAEKFETSPVETEVAWMKNVFSRCRFPKNLTAKERAVFEQSISILKMSQVAENEILPFSRGQILASLRPGVWSISWVRDAVFAIEAMTEIGLFDEARRGLEFMLRAQPTGQFRRFFDEKQQKEVGVGVDYQISVTRYFGSGREESDFNEFGPNIELDGFGLFLRAFSGYVEASGDAAFFEKWHGLIDSKIAFPILKNIDSSGLIRAESGPWEHHLPGRRWAWTTGASGIGLEKWAALETRFGRENEAAHAASQRLKTGIFENLVFENRVVKGNAQDSKMSDRYFFDAAVFELFASGFLTEKSLFESHMAAAEPVLGVRGKPAFIRINSSDSYENQEWPFAGLRVAVARARFGDRKGAKKLVDRVTDLAAKNNGIIPEIVALEDEQFRGAVPMVGYGAGAWILARINLEK